MTVPDYVAPTFVNDAPPALDAPRLNGLTQAVQRAENRLTRLGVNVRDFGAIGDGISRPLSAGYSTLAAAQAAFGSYVDSLTCQLDWACAQKAALSGAPSVFYPPGHYITNRQIAPADFQDHYGVGYGTWIDNIAARNQNRAGAAADDWYDSNPFTLGHMHPVIQNSAQYPQFAWAVGDLAPIVAGDCSITVTNPSALIAAAKPWSVGDIVALRCSNPSELAGVGAIFPFQMWNRIVAWNTSTGVMELEVPIPVSIQASPGSPTGTETYLHGPKLELNANSNTNQGVPWRMAQNVTIRDMRMSGLTPGGQMGAWRCKILNVDMESQYGLAPNAAAFCTFRDIRFTWTKRFLEIKNWSHDCLFDNIDGSYRYDPSINTGPNTAMSIGEQSFGLDLRNIRCFRGRDHAGKSTNGNVRCLEVFGNDIRLHGEFTDYAANGQTEVWAVKSHTLVARPPADIELDLVVKTRGGLGQYGVIGNDANLDGVANDADPNRVTLRLNQRVMDGGTLPTSAVRVNRGSKLLMASHVGDTMRCASTVPAEAIERAPNLLTTVTGPVSYPSGDTLIGTFAMAGTTAGDTIGLTVQPVATATAGSYANLSVAGVCAATGFVSVYLTNRSATTFSTGNAAGSSALFVLAVYQRMRA